VSQDWFSIWKERFHTVFPDPVISFPIPRFPSPSLNFQAYTGLYQNDYYGEANILEQDGKLYLILGPKEEKFALSPLNRDAFYFETRGENSIGLTQLIFTVDGTGIAKQLVIDAFNKNGLGTFRKNQSI
jgi:hypothetical protein